MTYIANNPVDGLAFDRKWIVDIKGSPGGTFEISVLRSNNEHGKRSYGWVDEDKVLISGSDPASWSVTPLVFKKLKLLAEEVAKELNDGP